MGGTEEKKKKEKASRKKRKRDDDDGDGGAGDGADDRARKKKGKHHRKEKKKKKKHKHKHKHKRERKDEERITSERRRGKHDGVKDEDEDEDMAPTDPAGSGEGNATGRDGGGDDVARTASIVKKEEDGMSSPPRAPTGTDGANDRGKGRGDAHGHGPGERRAVKKEEDEEEEYQNDLLDLDLDRDHDDDDGIEYVDDEGEDVDDDDGNEEEGGGAVAGAPPRPQPPSAMRFPGFPAPRSPAGSTGGSERVVGFEDERDSGGAVAVGGEEMEVEVRLTSVSKIDPAHDPVVVSFPSGVPRSVVGGGGGGGGGNNGDAAAGAVPTPPPPVFKWYQRRNTSRRGKAIRGMDDADVDAGGVCSYDSCNAGRGYDERLTMLYVGVYDRVEGTVELVPAAEKGTVFALRQRVRSSGGAEAEGGAAAAAPTAAGTPSTWTEKRQALFADFGSTKKQRVLRSAAANKVTADSVVGGLGNVKMEYASVGGAATANGGVSKAVGSVVANGVGGQKRSAVEEAMEEARRNFLPPFDPEATAPHEVYDLTTGIAGEEAWSHIVRAVDACLRKGGDGGWIDALTGGAGAGQDKPHWPEVLMDVLRSIGGGGGEEQRRRIRLALLLRNLVEFHSAFSRTYYPGTPDDLTRRVRSVPRVVSRRLLDLFASPMDSDGQQQQQRGGRDGGSGGGGGGFAFTKQLRDKRLLHALLLYVAAHGDDMRVGSIDEFLKELELDPKHATSLLRQAGCTATRVRGAGGGTSVSLRVPLIFPQPKRTNRS